MVSTLRGRTCERRDSYFCCFVAPPRLRIGSISERPERSSFEAGCALTMSTMHAVIAQATLLCLPGHHANNGPSKGISLPPLRCPLANCPPSGFLAGPCRMSEAGLLPPLLLAGCWLLACCSSLLLPWLWQRVHTLFLAAICSAGHRREVKPGPVQADFCAQRASCRGLIAVHAAVAGRFCEIAGLIFSLGPSDNPGRGLDLARDSLLPSAKTLKLKRRTSDHCSR